MSIGVGIVSLTPKSVLREVLRSSNERQKTKGARFFRSEYCRPDPSTGRSLVGKG